ncbi:hypothetical protein [Plantactinospora sp. CA-290183]|uniref:hypothetical protein n=1 Tax=Plantactinospora sp. CA-290183 TaxID=3240006 RepID=UPI003D8BB296
MSMRMSWTRRWWRVRARVRDYRLGRRPLAQGRWPAVSPRPPHITPGTDIPEVPEGTVLRLWPHEWTHCATVRDGAYLEMTVTRVHRNVTREVGDRRWVWVAGHRHPACRREPVEPHPPCLQLMAPTDVLDRAVHR